MWATVHGVDSQMAFLDGASQDLDKEFRGTGWAEMPLSQVPASPKACCAWELGLLPSLGLAEQANTLATTRSIMQSTF